MKINVRIFSADFLIPVIVLTSCNGGMQDKRNGQSEIRSDSSAQTRSASSGNTEEKLIAQGFRSESLIVYPENEQTWYGKIDRKKLVDGIFNAVYSGRVTPCNFFSGNPMTIDEVKHIESSIDTVYVEDFETGRMEMKIVDKELKRNEISKVFVKEDWYFDEDAFTMKKRVISIAPAKQSFDEQGNPRGYEPLFLVKFNEEKPL